MRKVFGLSADEMVELHAHYKDIDMKVDFIIVEGETLYNPTNIGNEQVSEEHLIKADLTREKEVIVFSGSDTHVARLDSKKQ